MKIFCCPVWFYTNMSEKPSDRECVIFCDLCSGLSGETAYVTQENSLNICMSRDQIAVCHGLLGWRA